MPAREVLSAFVSLVIPPCKLKIIALRLLGWKIGENCKVGFSWVRGGYVDLASGVRIGHLNYMVCSSINLKANSYIQNLNVIKGPLVVVLHQYAAVGNLNKIKRAAQGVVWGRAIFKLGSYSKVTSNHVIDCTRSVTFGEYSTLAGLASQLWTHGYIHAERGLGRFRIDGPIRIGSNVYIGSACVVNAAVRIANGTTVGASTCVSKSLTKPGLYVGQGLRWIPYDYDTAKGRYPEVKVDGLIETVHLKRPE